MIQASQFFKFFILYFGKNEKSLKIYNELIELLSDVNKKEELRNMLKQSEEFPDLINTTQSSGQMSISYTDLLSRDNKNKKVKNEEFPELPNLVPPGGKRAPPSEREKGNVKKIQKLVIVKEVEGSLKSKLQIKKISLKHLIQRARKIFLLSVE